MSSSEEEPPTSYHDVQNKLEGGQKRKHAHFIGDDGTEISFEERFPRRCTNLLCSILFLIFWAGAIAIAVIGLSQGEPTRLTNGQDYMGVTCGSKPHADQSNVPDINVGKQEMKPNIYYPRTGQDLASALKNKRYFGICVKKCPKEGDVVCKYGYDHLPLVQKRLMATNPKDGPCWNVGLETEDNFNYCNHKQSLDVILDRRFCPIPGTDNKKFFNFDTSADPTLKDPTLWIYRTNIADAALSPPVNAMNINYYIKDQKTNEWIPNKDTCGFEMVFKNIQQKKKTGNNVIQDQAAQFRRMMMRWAGDVKFVWHEIFLFGFIGSLVLGFLSMYFLSWGGSTAIWFIIYGVQVACIVLSLIFANKGGMIDLESSYSNLKVKAGIEKAVNGSITGETKAREESSHSYEVAACLMIILTVVIMCLICYWSKSIDKAIKVVEAAAKSINRMKSLILWPFIPYLGQAALFAWFMYTGVHVASIADLKNTTGELIASAPGTANLVANASSYEVSHEDIQQFMMSYHIFAFIWTEQLLQAISICTIAGAVSSWYFTRNKDDEDKFGKMGIKVVGRAFWNCIRYHFGSLVFGAAIIAIVTIIRFLFQKLDKQTKNLQKSNAFVNMVMQGLRYCIACFEKIMKFVSDQAYIVIAIKGNKGYCESAKYAVDLLRKNASIVVITQILINLISTLAKIFITVLSTWFFFLYIDNAERYTYGGKEALSVPAIPVILTFAIAYIVANTFLNTFGTCVETVLLCFCVDKKENLTNPKGPFVEPGLIEAMGDKPKDTLPAVAAKVDKILTINGKDDAPLVSVTIKGDRPALLLKGDPVRFKENSLEFANAEENTEKIRQLTAYLKAMNEVKNEDMNNSKEGEKYCEFYHIRLDGHTTCSGDNGTILSFMRAATLAAHLSDKAHIPKAYFHPYGHAFTKPIYTDHTKKEVDQVRSKRVKIKFLDPSEVAQINKESAEQWQVIRNALEENPDVVLGNYLPANYSDFAPPGTH